MRKTGVVLILFAALRASALAQDAAPPDQGAAPTAVGHARTPAHRPRPVVRTRTTPTATHDPSAAERAAALAEGRKKFFEQQQGFESDTVPSPVTTTVFPVGADGYPIVFPSLKRR